MLDRIDIKFLVCHIHKTSARLRFLCFQNKNLPNGAKGHVCAPSPLPSLVSILDHRQNADSIDIHPSAALKRLCEQINVVGHQLTIVPNFRVWIEAPRQTISIYLAADNSAEPFTLPPNCYWIELPESWHLSALERDLLREAYTCLLE